MRWKLAKRVYSTKLNKLLTRPDFTKTYPQEFLNKMLDSEISIYFSEIKNQLNIEGIPTKNINYYNKVFKNLVNERENIFQMFKTCGQDNYNEDYIG